jgi:hypothetical protein
MDMSHLAAGWVNPSPSPTSSPRDFDFLHGNWQIHNRKLRSRLTGCTEWTEFDFTSETRSILGGFGNIDETGNTMRLFDAETRYWIIYSAWAGATYVDEMKGSFEDRIGRFYSRDSHDGKPVICQFQWDATDPDAPVWSQALSPDEGETWEWNWTMSFSLISRK